MSIKLVSLLFAAATAACVVPPPAQPTTTTASSPSPSPSPSGSPDVTADDGQGPPAVRRVVPGEQATTSGPYDRGDYIIALDYRPEGYGTYGFLYHDARHVWIVENDAVVSGSAIDENGPELQEVVARWRAAEQQRHEIVMRGIEALPKGCIDGCAYDAYSGGRYVGTRITY